MPMTFENMLQYLDSILAQKGSDGEIVSQVRAWCYAAHKHVSDTQQHVCDLYEGEENEQEKRTKKEKEKEVLDKGQPSGSFKAHEASNKVKYMTPEEIRRKVNQDYLDRMEQKWLTPKYPSLMTQMPVPLSGAQYLSWLTHYPKSFVERKLQSLESHPSHYDRTSVPATINDWIKTDYKRMNLVQRQNWNTEVAAQRPQILQMINNNLKPKRNAKQTTINFESADCAGTDTAATQAAEPADGGTGAAHTDDD